MNKQHQPPAERALPPYAIVRSRRKTVAIRITREAAVEVRAPLHAGAADIARIVASKRAWILGHLQACEQQARQRAAFSLHYGDAVMVCGRDCVITAQTSPRDAFDGRHLYVPPNLAPEQLVNAVVQACKRLARPLFEQKVTNFAAKMGLKPSAVRVSSARTRWGSCSAKNSLSFSWRLVMAEDDVIDYVVVHELAHIEQRNHGEGFWAVVAAEMPDYRQRRAALRTLEKRLACQRWA